MRLVSAAKASSKWGSDRSASGRGSIPPARGSAFRPWKVKRNVSTVGSRGEQVEGRLQVRRRRDPVLRRRDHDDGEELLPVELDSLRGEELPERLQQGAEHPGELRTPPRGRGGRGPARPGGARRGR